MIRLAALLGIVSGFLMSLGVHPRGTIPLGILMLIVMGFVQIFRKKPFGHDFVVSIIILALLPALICWSTNWIGWPWLVLTLVVSSALYLYLNTDRKQHSINSGGERTPLYPSHFENKNDSWYESRKVGGYEDE